MVTKKSDIDMRTELISHDHKMMRDLIDIIESASSKRVGRSFDLILFERLINTLSDVFEREKSVMETISYHVMLDHLDEHRLFIETLNMMRHESMINTNSTFVVEYVTDWLKRHLVSFDKPLTDFISPHGNTTRVSEEPVAGLRRPKTR